MSIVSAVSIGPAYACNAIRGSIVYPAAGVDARGHPTGGSDEGYVVAFPLSARRTIVIGVLALAGLAGIGLGALAAGPGPSPAPQASASPTAAGDVSPTPTGTPSATPEPTPTPTATPTPGPSLVAAPLTGRMVLPSVAARHAIAVMVDDHPDARPQSGFNDAAVVWQAPAEGGIPRYMMIFQDRVAPSVGPVRSARQYFIAWASEWRSVYAHVGGSPQALQTLRERGRGQYVYNADEFRWGGIYFHRTKDRFPPHNVYSAGKELRTLARRLGAKDTLMKPAWRFGPDAPMAARPKGGTITVVYSWNTITYRYDRTTNTYRRSVSREKKQVDRGTGQLVAPKNVVIMVMSFAPLNDGSKKHRLEAQFLGKGVAWISSNGKTVKGTWSKAAFTKPTRFFGPDGKPVRLTVGQTFVQVMPRGSKITIADGKVPPPPPVASPSPTPTPTPTASPSAALSFRGVSLFPWLVY
jgi:DUF3048 family protein